MYKPKHHYFYLAVTEVKDGKCFSSVLRVSDCENLTCVLKHYYSANIMPSKKKAQEVVDFWNRCYKANGTYMCM